LSSFSKADPPFRLRKSESFKWSDIFTVDQLWLLVPPEVDDLEELVSFEAQISIFQESVVDESAVEEVKGSKIVPRVMGEDGESDLLLRFADSVLAIKKALFTGTPV
jgi:hypothetical protein